VADKVTRLPRGELEGAGDQDDHTSAGCHISPIADMDVHQTIVTAAPANCSAEEPVAESGLGAAGTGLLS
jgi:hypothetical protein